MLIQQKFSLTKEGDKPGKTFCWLADSLGRQELLFSLLVDSLGEQELLFSLLADSLGKQELLFSLLADSLDKQELLFSLLAHSVGDGSDALRCSGEVQDELFVKSCSGEDLVHGHIFIMGVGLVNATWAEDDGGDAGAGEL